MRGRKINIYFWSLSLNHGISDLVLDKDYYDIDDFEFLLNKALNKDDFRKPQNK